MLDSRRHLDRRLCLSAADRDQPYLSAFVSTPFGPEVKRMNLKLLERCIRRGTLTLLVADELYRFGDGRPAATIRFRNRRALARVLRDPGLRFGEAYMAGDWDLVEGTLHDLLTVLIGNLHSELAPSRTFRRLQILLRSWNGLHASRSHVSHHYDLDEALFRSFLDRDMHYSCAYFREPTHSLEEAQQAKCAHIARKLCLKPGQHVLDIGSGWGSLALFLASHHDVHVVGLTLSKEQLAAARRSARARGLEDRVRFLLQDYREHAGRYDRVVSVGMFEHVGRRNYPTFFGHVRRLLDTDGIAVLHTIGSSGPPCPVNPWIRRHIFPGGYLPSLSDIAPVVEETGFVTSDIEILRRHYALTLAEWNRRFQAVRERFVDSHGEAFCRMWELYLVASRVEFEVGGLIVMQWQLARHNAAVPLTRDYLYPVETGGRRRRADVTPLRQVASR
jgi:cyclopropane-fatty-acyl-phospholipid synthase